MLPQCHGGRQRLPQNPHKSRPTSIPLRVRGCEHAEISGGKLRLSMNGRRHFHTYPFLAIPVSMRVLQKAREEDVPIVILTDTTTARVYEATITQILSEGELCGCCPADTILLPLPRWRWVNAPSEQPQVALNEDPQPPLSIGDPTHD